MPPHKRPRRHSIRMGLGLYLGLGLGLGLVVSFTCPVFPSPNAKTTVETSLEPKSGTESRGETSVLLLLLLSRPLRRGDGGRVRRVGSGPGGWSSRPSALL